MKKNRKPALLRTIAVCLLILFTSAVVYGGSLQEEFDALCVHTQDAESLSLEKLRELVAACDQLQKKIAGSNDAKKKILLFRLNKCRNFLAYVIELKVSENSGKTQ